MNVSVIIPIDPAGDGHRIAAFDTVFRRLTDLHPEWQILADPTPAAPGEWSKGAAVAELTAAASGDVLIIHDADSYVDPDNLAELAGYVANRGTAWAIPHRSVYRLTPEETARVHQGYRARRGHVCRTPYPAVPGGGITVLTRTAYDTVRGIDPRFIGWGGEDVAFGLALTSLVGEPILGDSPLVHLWHPHPAPNLRGSAESEALVADYRAAHGLRRRMTQLTNRRPVTDPDPLEHPARFRLRTPQARRNVRIAAGRTIYFVDGAYDTTDPDLADALDRHPAVARRSPQR